MKRFDFGQTMQIIANLGVVAGIFLLVYELRQNADASQLEAAQAHLAVAHQLDLLIATDADLVAMFVDPEKDAMEQLRWERFTFALLRSWENGHFLNSRSALDDGLWEAQVNLIFEILTENPPIQQYWRENRHVYSDSFNVFLEGILDDQRRW